MGGFCICCYVYIGNGVKSGLRIRNGDMNKYWLLIMFLVVIIILMNGVFFLDYWYGVFVV